MDIQVTGFVHFDVIGRHLVYPDLFHKLCLRIE